MLTKEDKELILELRNSGKTIREICEQVGSTMRVVQKVTSGIKVTDPNKKAALLELLNDREAMLKVVSKKYKMSETSLSNLLCNFRLFLEVTGLSPEDYPRFKTVDLSGQKLPKPRAAFEWSVSRRRSYPWMVLVSGDRFYGVTEKVVSRHKTMDGAQKACIALNKIVNKKKRKQQKIQDGEPRDYVIREDSDLRRKI